APIPPAGAVIGRSRVKAVIDKGADKGAVIIQERKLFDQANNNLLATLTAATFCRADGGFGKGDPSPPKQAWSPEGGPDVICDLPTLPQAALIYRLCADPNPLHVDPAVSSAAGFPRPILHGLCSFGVAAHAILKSFC